MCQEPKGLSAPTSNSSYPWLRDGEGGNLTSLWGMVWLSPKRGGPSCGDEANREEEAQRRDLCPVPLLWAAPWLHMSGSGQLLLPALPAQSSSHPLGFSPTSHPTRFSFEDSSEHGGGKREACGGGALHVAEGGGCLGPWQGGPWRRCRGCGGDAVASSGQCLLGNRVPTLLKSPRLPLVFQLLSQEPSNGLSSDPTVPLDRLAVIFR